MTWQDEDSSIWFFTKASWLIEKINGEKNNSVVVSQNHRMVGVGMDL